MAKRYLYRLDDNRDYDLASLKIIDMPDIVATPYPSRDESDYVKAHYGDGWVIRNGPLYTPAQERAALAALGKPSKPLPNALGVIIDELQHKRK